MKITIEFDSLEEMKHFQMMGFSELSPSPANKITLYDLLPDHEQFATRARNCLVNAEISTVEQLLTKTENELLHLPNLGRKSLNQIVAALASRGLRLS